MKEPFKELLLEIERVLKLEVFVKWLAKHLDKLSTKLKS